MAIRTERVYVVSAVRTAIGTFGGALAYVPPCDLATHVSSQAIVRAGISASQVQNVVFGHVINTEPRDMYLSRVAAIGADVSETVPAMNVNRLCGSGLQAIVSGAQFLQLGHANVALVGGAESMSRAPYISQATRFGQKMGDIASIDMLTGTLTDPFGHGHMGVTAENVAAASSIDREAQDAFALESHRRASAAIAAGYFEEQIAPIELKSRKGVFEFSVDEHVRQDVTLESLRSLRPMFQKGGSVTAGNASGINDGAAALVLMSESELKKNNVAPLAEIIGYAHAGVDPKVMGAGPVPAVQKLCEVLNIRPQEFDVVESNEAFAAQACAVSEALGLDSAKVNPNGGAIALGHPVGATGAIIATKLVHELVRTSSDLGLATMCIGGGQGIAVAFCRV